MLPGVQPPALQQPQALTWPLWVAGNKWYKQHLSYRLVNWPQHLPEPAVRGAVRAAFQLWSNVSALEFWEAPATGPADIRLTFFQGDHNDGLSNAFDGPGADSLSSTWQEGDPARRGRRWRAREHALSLWPCPSCITLQRALNLPICQMGTVPARFCAMWLLGWSDEVLQGKCLANSTEHCLSWENLLKPHHPSPASG